MEAVTASRRLGTGSKTMADLCAAAAEKFAGRRAVHPQGRRQWVDISYEELRP